MTSAALPLFGSQSDLFRIIPLVGSMRDVFPGQFKTRGEVPVYEDEWKKKVLPVWSIFIGVHHEVYGKQIMKFSGFAYEVFLGRF